VLEEMSAVGESTPKTHERQDEKKKLLKIHIPSINRVLKYHPLS